MNFDEPKIQQQRVNVNDNDDDEPNVQQYPSSEFFKELKFTLERAKLKNSEDYDTKDITKNVCKCKIN